MSTETREPSREALLAASEIIELLIDNGHGEYSHFRKEIAIEILDKGVWNGNYDVQFDPQEHDENSTLSSFRVIQEDEYDQSMDEDEKPDWDEHLGMTEAGYVWVLS